jgi:hypothetical protein
MAASLIYRRQIIVGFFDDELINLTAILADIYNFHKFRFNQNKFVVSEKVRPEIDLSISINRSSIVGLDRTLFCVPLL